MEAVPGECQTVAGNDIRALGVGRGVGHGSSNAEGINELHKCVPDLGDVLELFLFMAVQDQTLVVEQLPKGEGGGGQGQEYPQRTQEL